MSASKSCKFLAEPSVRRARPLQAGGGAPVYSQRNHAGRRRSIAPPHHEGAGTTRSCYPCRQSHGLSDRRRIRKDDPRSVSDEFHAPRHRRERHPHPRRGERRADRLLLLLHGHPQNSPTWHKIAPELAERFTVVAPTCAATATRQAAGGENHANYSKRAMARDQVEVMRGTSASTVSGRRARPRRAGRAPHGARPPGRVERLAVLDIAPTATMYARTNRNSPPDISGGSS